MAKKQGLKRERAFYAELISQLLTLATSGFGLAAALAWNQAIQKFVKDFIEPSLPGSGLTSQFIYAILVTILAVIITYQLSRIASKLQR